MRRCTFAIVFGFALATGDISTPQETRVARDRELFLASILDEGTLSVYGGNLAKVDVDAAMAFVKEFKRPFPGDDYVVMPEVLQFFKRAQDIGALDFFVPHSVESPDELLQFMRMPSKADLDAFVAEERGRKKSKSNTSTFERIKGGLVYGSENVVKRFLNPKRTPKSRPLLPELLQTIESASAWVLFMPTEKVKDEARPLLADVPILEVRKLLLSAIDSIVWSTVRFESDNKPAVVVVEIEFVDDSAVKIARSLLDAALQKLPEQLPSIVDRDAVNLLLENLRFRATGRRIVGKLNFDKTRSAIAKLAKLGASPR